MDTVAYVDQARPGQENMDIDRRLLEETERTGVTNIRIYRWSEPTLSLGHFQAGEDRSIHPASQSLAMVLRASGGGAIVHHHEWTYAVATRVGKNRIGAATELYDQIHDALVAGLNELGWSASKWAKPTCESQTAVSIEGSSELKGCSTSGATKAKEPFLCFLRRSCGDIVVGGYKVVGSAQRRLGSSVLQHGSILLSTSPYAPELPGLFDLAGKVDANQRGPQTDKETFGRTVLSWISNAVA